MSLIAANEESDPSAILNGFWVTPFFLCLCLGKGRIVRSVLLMFSIALYWISA